MTSLTPRPRPPPSMAASGVRAPLKEPNATNATGQGGGPDRAGDKPVYADDDERMVWEERAAIREFDGGLDRQAAERLAWLDIMSARWMVQGARHRSQVNMTIGEAPSRLRRLPQVARVIAKVDSK